MDEARIENTRKMSTAFRNASNTGSWSLLGPLDNHMVLNTWQSTRNIAPSGTIERAKREFFLASGLSKALLTPSMTACGLGAQSPMKD